MTMFDQILAVLSLAMLGGFMGILAWFVPEVDLVTVVVIVLALAVYDFFIADRLHRKPGG